MIAHSCGFQGFGDLRRDRESFVHRDRSPGETVGQRRSFDQFQDERGDVILLFQTMNLADARVVQTGEDLGLSPKPGEPIRIVSKGLRQDLQRDLPVQLGVGCAIDLAHAALSDEGGHLVVRDASSDLERHGQRGPN